MSRALRRSVDVAAALMGLGVVAVVGLYATRQVRERTQTQGIAEALREFDRTLAIQAGSKQVELTSRGWPVTVDPGWFLGSPPRNTLVPQDRPWVEVAPPDQAELLDPPLRISGSREIAGFWYNPYQGVVRARVPMAVSERKSIDLYNQVNRRTIDAIYQPHAVESEPTAETSPEDPAAEFSSDKNALTGAEADRGI
jgi:hypothetical protein